MGNVQMQPQCKHVVGVHANPPHWRCTTQHRPLTILQKLQRWRSAPQQTCCRKHGRQIRQYSCVGSKNTWASFLQRSAIALLCETGSHLEWRDQRHLHHKMPRCRLQGKTRAPCEVLCCSAQQHATASRRYPQLCGQAEELNVAGSLTFAHDRARRVSLSSERECHHHP